jgi:hypothetical protein
VILLKKSTPNDWKLVAFIQEGARYKPFDLVSFTSPTESANPGSKTIQDWNITNWGDCVFFNLMETDIATSFCWKEKGFEEESVESP